MTKKLRVAIDGCGDLTTRTILPHLMQPDAVAAMKVVALCDIDPDRLTHAAEEFDIVGRYASIDSLLAHSDAEAVLIIVPANLHADHARRCITAGRHVYVQKPMAGSVAESTDLIDAATRAGVRLAAAPNQALWPLYTRIRDLIGSGAIGEPYFAQGSTMGWEGHRVHHGSDPSWCFAAGSGPLRDHGVYGIQALTTMIGEVAAVSAFSSIRVPDRLWRDTQIPVTEADNTALLFKFRSGALGVLPEAWAFGNDATATFRISGLEGVFIGNADYASYRGIFPWSCVLHAGQSTTEIRVVPDDAPFLTGRHGELPNPHVWADIRHLALSIAGEFDLSNPSAIQARHTVDIIEAAFRSAEQGRTLAVETCPT